MARARTGVVGRPREQFESTHEMASAVRGYGKSLGIAGDLDAPAERYWRSSRV